MRNLEVYVDNNNVAQHLALKSDYSGSHVGIDLPYEYRSLCGGKIDNMSVKPSHPNETNLPCNVCMEQLKMWLEVHDDARKNNV